MTVERAALAPQDGMTPFFERYADRTWPARLKRLLSVTRRRSWLFEAEQQSAQRIERQW